jgi:predicted transcriptional regulator
MLVKNWMSKNVVTVDVNDSMQEATKLLKENNIRIKKWLILSVNLEGAWSAF